MLETLAGRLKWERTGDGIRVEIPARRSNPLLTQVAWLFFLSGPALLFVGIPDKGTTAFDLLFVWVFLITGLLSTIVRILWEFAGKTILTIDPNRMVLCSRIMELDLKRRSYANENVRLMRFVPAVTLFWSKRPSGIWFIENNALRKFAKAITPAEASVLIDKMLGVYRFELDTTAQDTGPS
jgi:hypothetical protein